MHLTHRELWTELHGMVFGAGFLLAFAGGFVLLWQMCGGWMTREGEVRGRRVMAVGMWAMTVLAWAAVIAGTYVVYPWYRAKPPAAGTAGVVLAGYPKYLLMSKPETEDWHEFGMEWKEHVAWLAPIAMTAVAFVATRHGRRIASDPWLGRTVLFVYGVAFFCAAVAGLLGALIDKAAPVR